MPSDVKLARAKFVVANAILCKLYKRKVVKKATQTFMYNKLTINGDKLLIENLTFFDAIWP